MISKLGYMKVMVINVQKTKWKRLQDDQITYWPLKNKL